MQPVAHKPIALAPQSFESEKKGASGGKEFRLLRLQDTRLLVFFLYVSNLASAALRYLNRAAPGRDFCQMNSRNGVI